MIKSFGSTVADDTTRVLKEHEFDMVAGGVTATVTLKLPFGSTPDELVSTDKLDADS